MLGVPVQRPRVRETTALGAAYLAGLATGFWRDQAEIAAHWALDRAFSPGDARRRARPPLCWLAQGRLPRARLGRVSAQRPCPVGHR